MDIHGYDVFFHKVSKWMHSTRILSLRSGWIFENEVPSSGSGLVNLFSPPATYPARNSRGPLWSGLMKTIGFPYLPETNIAPEKRPPQ